MAAAGPPGHDRAGSARNACPSCLSGGYHDAGAIAAANEADLAAAVLHFAAAAEGQRILRQGEPPAVEKIKGWIESAAARVAA